MYFHVEHVEGSPINHKSGTPQEIWSYSIWVVVWKVSFQLLPQKVPALLPKKTKLGSKMLGYSFIGHALNSSAYRFLVHKSEISNIHVCIIIKSRGVVFIKDIFPYKRQKIRLLRKNTWNSIQEWRTQWTNSQCESWIKKKSEIKRLRISKSFKPDFRAYELESEPQTFKEAISTPKAQM